MRPFLSDGWLCVPYDGHDVALVRIGIAGPSGDPVWTAAFLDYVDGVRVAKIRPPAVTGRARVWLEVVGAATMVGNYPT